MNNQKPKFVTANPYTYKDIKPLRDALKKASTKAEIIMWKKLKNKQIGFKCMSSKESVLLLKEYFRFSNIKLSI